MVLTQRLILNLNLMTACRRDPHDVASMARGWDLHHLHAIAATWHRIDGVFMITRESTRRRVAPRRTRKS